MIEFYKIQGSGNDFIIIDNRDNLLRDVGKIDEFVKTACRQHVAVGADGLIIIESSDKANFRWRFFNADGSEVEMCGNGGRCAARFAVIKGIAPEKMSFETRAGIIDAEVTGDIVKLRLTDPKDIRKAYTIAMGGTATPVNSINTGVPHVVAFVNDLDGHDVCQHRQDDPAPPGVSARRDERQFCPRDQPAPDQGADLRARRGGRDAGLRDGGRGSRPCRLVDRTR